MAPEQLEGREADSRSDIFAFGAVLYEMVTGRKAFEGKSHASIIGAIMHAEPPPMSTLQRLTPPLLDHLARTCLAKDPDERWQSSFDLKVELQGIATTAPLPDASVAATPGSGCAKDSPGRSAHSGS
jgi:serine/threonine protein kinase